MEINDMVLPAGLALLALVFLALYLLAERRSRAMAADIARLTAETQGLGRLQQDIEAERARLAAMAEESRQALQARTAAETRLQESEKNLATLRQERDAAFSERNAANRERQEAEKQVALALQKVAETDKRMADWDKVRAEGTEAAKAAALAAAGELSNKLIADHKRESEEAKKKTEERIAKTTEGLTGQFDKIVQTVSALHGQVGDARTTLDTVYRALSSPGGAGRFAEIGLENLLKQMGLEPGRDFRVQHNVAGDGERGNLRPDAIIFLPNNSVWVIDSKASKFLVELAEAEGAEQQEEAHANLARTMNQHLRALSAKDYGRAILDDYRKSGRQGNLGRVMNIMYLPNEGALEKINIADPDFPSKALKADIILAGPTGLTGLIGFASMEIGLARQDENRDRIVEQTASLLESVSVMLGHAERVGKGIRGAAESFGKLTTSVNSRLLPRARGLVNLGVQPGGKKSLPGNLPVYQVLASEDSEVIEGEAEDVTAQASLPRPDDD